MSEPRRPRPAPGAAPTSFLVALVDLRAQVEALAERLDRLEQLAAELVKRRTT